MDEIKVRCPSFGNNVFSFKVVIPCAIEVKDRGEKHTKVGLEKAVEELPLILTVKLPGRRTLWREGVSADLGRLFAFVAKRRIKKIRFHPARNATE